MQASSLPLASCRVLVVEDEVVQALDLERSLQQLGCTVLGPTDTRAEAVDLLRQERPNLALLDLVLRDGPALPLAEQLRAWNVPMVAVTGCDPTLLEHPLLRGVPLLRKPYGLPELRAAVRGLFRVDLTASLARTERRIEQGWDRIRVQAAIVSRLAAKGHDTCLAEQLLQAYERTLTILRSRREHLVRELEAQGGPAVRSG
jgi:DNA-binding response OmpR family regulator